MSVCACRVPAPGGLIPLELQHQTPETCVPGDRHASVCVPRVRLAGGHTAAPTSEF